ncbi:MAG: hypothetical protein A2747_00680 [Candidatus Yonathbacteria bacterium RIFCSPHIGHO2_01_FULL_44_41]|uniref:Uncharacterized protein n=1 Tax=Candidatus Yonathbacteria bacterium RIFCSPHIGHO2_02_FULL_44_14 TaxID=1802724 RepID=A0A1G2S811_9BACT|nr:MAG: hypothetical protein A2747_00680 [Candidatus Yonathbacteria bacterium RIFCSPHIGHO2_01_FULL_44_41]OHA80411.1 MAG: hypothetical protein A3D51_01120 [Candidatus Yonathbacteria bacterium RIFCSPHIGHO2_02_FULL_44_14]OHA80734.1 MAG: hypothetical protein A3B06_00050 [Candidatus Yonathbacteria bacterium RIFCSPLOWO2_01_FULL_43_20]
MHFFTETKSTLGIAFVAAGLLSISSFNTTNLNIGVIVIGFLFVYWGAMIDKLLPRREKTIVIVLFVLLFLNVGSVALFLYQVGLNKDIWRALLTILFNIYLIISVKEVSLRERVSEIRGYTPSERNSTKDKYVMRNVIGFLIVATFFASLYAIWGRGDATNVNLQQGADEPLSHEERAGQPVGVASLNTAINSADAEITLGALNQELENLQNLNTTRQSYKISEEHVMRAQAYIDDLERLGHGTNELSNIESSLKEWLDKSYAVGVKMTFASLRASAELLYDRDYDSTKYLKLCNNGAINGDDKLLMEQVRGFLSWMGRSSQKDLGIKCVSSAEGYAISAPLPGNNPLWCVDGTGYAGTGVADEESYKCQYKN